MRHRRSNASQALDEDSSAGALLDGVLPDDDPGRADTYQAWVGRLRAKRARNQETIGRLRDGDPGRRDPAGYWDPAAVFADGAHLDADVPGDRPDPLRVAAALRTLGLGSQATATEVEARYRALARHHHPDAHPHADPATRADHERRFREITAARDVLRRRRPGS